jgi:alanyl-tRNA synthetase
MSRREIAKRFGISPKELKTILGPIESVYAVSDHTKCLAFMLADGIVPSNAKEGYLARLVLRRAFRMLKSLDIAIPLEELVLKQIKTLRNSFPELEESVDRIVEIVALEKSRILMVYRRSLCRKWYQPRALRSIYPKTSILWLRVCTARNRRRRWNHF